MKILVGLGNPGAEYMSTPHSIGFETIDEICARIGGTWELKKSFQALLARGTLAGEQVMLVKPQTYMNLSGESVAPIVRYHNAKPADLVVVQDDIDLPVGKIRVRKSGSCGGHNGIRNIIERLGTSDFARVKVGVGREGARSKEQGASAAGRDPVISHVLGKFDPVTRGKMDVVVKAAADAVEAVLKVGPDRAMNLYNGWSLPENG